MTQELNKIANACNKMLFIASLQIILPGALPPDNKLTGSGFVAAPSSTPDPSAIPSQDL